jgi:hypothetical protein
MKIDIYYNKKNRSTEFITGEEITFTYYNQLVTVPASFRSDGCSIPRILWTLITPQIDGRTIIQSIKHDYLFSKKMGFWKSNWYYFKDLACGLSLFKRIIILIGLTLFGWTHYYF